MNTKELNKLLQDSRTLQAGLMPLTEAELEYLMNQEMCSNKPRKIVVERIHQRQCILRAKREREDLFRRMK